MLYAVLQSFNYLFLILVIHYLIYKVVVNIFMSHIFTMKAFYEQYMSQIRIIFLSLSIFLLTLSFAICKNLHHGIEVNKNTICNFNIHRVAFKVFIVIQAKIFYSVLHFLARQVSSFCNVIACFTINKLIVFGFEATISFIFYELAIWTSLYKGDNFFFIGSS